MVNNKIKVISILLRIIKLLVGLCPSFQISENIIIPEIYIKGNIYILSKCIVGSVLNFGGLSIKKKRDNSSYITLNPASTTSASYQPKTYISGVYGSYDEQIVLSFNGYFIPEDGIPADPGYYPKYGNFYDINDISIDDMNLIIADDSNLIIYGRLEQYGGGKTYCPDTVPI